MRKVHKIGLELELAPYISGEPVVAGRFMSACKANPIHSMGHMIHRDASMVELAMAPACDANELAANYHSAIAAAQSLVPDEVVLEAHPAVEYSSSELAMDPYASVMGCSESRNAYIPNPPRDGYTDNYRYGGMHVNIEADHVTDMDAILLDSWLGLHSVIESEQPFKDQIIRRRRWYGLAGEFRLKEFGIEYRTLPSCSFDPDNTQLLWDRVEHSLNMDIRLVALHADRIQQAIQNCDADMAGEILQEIGDDLLN